MNTADPSDAATRQKLPPAGTAGRYVVLHHTGIEADHFDLLVQFSEAEKLISWRVVMPPETWGERVEAERIDDHRDVYMTYEGSVSRDRGMVKRVGEGSAEVVSVAGQICRLRLQGSRPIEIELPC